MNWKLIKGPWALGAWLLCMAVATPAQANLSALVVIEPTLRKDAFMVSRSALEASLSKLLNQPVKATVTDDLADAMRATRSGGHDIFIAPPQVAASALSHGFELVGSTDTEEQYVLIGKAGLNSVAELRQGRIYLPQQDSIYTYLARGLLTSSGLSFKDLSKVQYERYPQAGLSAIMVRTTEATMVRRDDWELWQKDHAGIAKVLATSGTVPGGFSVVVKNDLPTELRAQLVKWFAGSASLSGLKPVSQRAELNHYKKIAELGTFTPTALPGATVVAADEVKRLAAEGAVVVDTRTEKEFKAKRIPGAVFVPYVEKSLKDVSYDTSVDNFAGLKALDGKKAVIFHCNGAECWKSYKASQAALKAGFGKVYWYRGGLPDWEATGQKLLSQ